VADELELKAVVEDPVALKAHLAAAGAVAGFRGLMTDQRFDRGGTLARRDEVLRVRSYRPAAGPARSELAWKGPTRRSPEGYKRRAELTCEVRAAPDEPTPLLEALGYAVVQTIDRWVETWTLAGAMLRLEWYPRMDLLLEVEGPPPSIEAAIVATGIPRQAFTADALIDFVARYEPRTGRVAALAITDLRGEAPGWETA
jgi:adenylate cyclase class IV